MILLALLLHQIPNIWSS